MRRNSSHDIARIRQQLEDARAARHQAQSDRNDMGEHAGMLARIAFDRLRLTVRQVAE